ncbi:MAG TPA: glycoside hydrolase family 38 C-terminal domain-containing protein [Candidatus Sumerlaeia bacterium]|nr:glycoside hydrolase family 38 C-terminal domain-containing protein [Candidatus Sumerlaeia bacterium]
MNKKPVLCHVVSETHWDRAWYLPFERFRARLVDMMDHLMQMLRRADFKYFVFDGQMVPFEDYLEIKPAEKKRLAGFVQKGKLIVGPFYILPDEYLISGEAHIRNLLIGHKLASEFGPVQKVGYLPDPFGHISQIPQILNGFGIESFFFMRGMGDHPDKMGLEFWWDSPNKTGRVLACHQACTYSNALMMGIPYREQELYPIDYDEALAHAERAADNLLKFGGAAILLFNNGTDHFFAQETIPQVIAYVNKHSKRLQLVHSTFAHFVKDILEARKDSLISMSGELHGGQYQWLLSGVLSTRVYLKQMNYLAQSTLERRAEPVSVFAWLLGADYPSDLFLYAWKTLLKNHPHDDICGCSVDAVHRDMVNRFEHVMQVSDDILKKSHDFILSAVKFKDEDAGSPILAINTRPHVRSGEVSVSMVIPHERYKGVDLEVADFRGNICPAIIERTATFTEPKFWGEQEMERIKVSFLAKDLPSAGYRAYYVREKTAAKITSFLKSSARAIENEFVKISINRNGTLNIEDKATGQNLPNAHYFEDCADAGDEYDFSDIKNDKILDTLKLKADVHTEILGGYKAVAHVSLKWQLPVSLTDDRTRRVSEMRAAPIEYDVILTSGNRVIEFRIKIQNNVKDHRLRVVFPTRIQTKTISVESKFDVINRPLVPPKTKTKWMQPPMNTHHQENFASLSDGKKGATFFTKGLCEYEAEPRQAGAAYHLTLLRCVGWLSRGDMNTRYANAGPTMETPEAQCRGEHVFEYALMLHRGNWEKAEVQTVAYNYATPVDACVFYHQVRDWKGAARLPEEASFIQIQPEGLILTGMKKCEERESVILRLYNPKGAPAEGALDFAVDVSQAWLNRLDETRLSPLPISAGHLIKFTCPSKGIITIEAVF